MEDSKRNSKRFKIWSVFKGRTNFNL